MPSVSKKQQQFMGALKLGLSINTSLVKYAHLLLNICSKVMKPIGITMSCSTTLALSLFLFLSKLKNNICVWGFKSQVWSNFFKHGNATRTRPFNSVRLDSSSFKVTRIIAHLTFTSINYFFYGIHKFLLGQCNSNVVFPRLIAFLTHRDGFPVKANSSFTINNSSNISGFFTCHIFSIPLHTHKVKEVSYVSCC